MNTNSKGESALERSSDRTKTRRASEIQLAQSFVDTVLLSGRKIFQEKRRLKESRAMNHPPTANSLQEVGLTEVEKPIFHKQSYYNRTLGLLAGFTTFGVLFGGGTILSKTSRQYVFQKIRHVLSKTPEKPNSSTAGKRLAESTAIGGAGRKRKVSANQYAALDRPSTTTANTIQSSSNSTNTTTSLISPSILSDETVLQLQFLVCAAASLMVGLGTAGSCFDHATFYQQLAQVPLQPGKSFLCAAMCPQLLQQRHDLLSEQQQQQHSLDAPSNNNSQAARMWKDPETIELEAITQLVHHCQLRSEYQAKLQSQLQHQKQQSKNQQQQEEDLTIPYEAVAIPEPGVSLQYKY